jgi:hypothetical protein
MSFLCDVLVRQFDGLEQLTGRANRRHPFIIAAVGSQDARKQVNDWSLFIRRNSHTKRNT